VSYIAGGIAMPTTKIADASGKMSEVSLDLSVSLVDKVASFARDNKADYFEDHSLDWALEEIVTRGCAEITRQIKTAKKTAQAKAAGKVMEQFNMTPELAAKFFEELRKQQAAEAAKQAKPTK
jgi:hypothetical protein